MTQRTNTKPEDFLDRLESLGYLVTRVTKRPSICSINGARVNTRSKSRARETNSGRSFFYSITYSVLQEVRWVIYITTDADHFFMFPSSFLGNLRERMYPDRKNANVGVFDLDWDNLGIVLRDGEVSIGEYYHDLVDRENYPDFE